MQPIESVLKSTNAEELISVLKVIVILAFVSDSVAQKLLTKDVLKSLKTLCANKNSEVSCYFSSRIEVLHNNSGAQIFWFIPVLYL